MPGGLVEFASSPEAVQLALKTCEQEIQLSIEHGKAEASAVLAMDRGAGRRMNVSSPKPNLQI